MHSFDNLLKEDPESTAAHLKRDQMRKVGLVVQLPDISERLGRICDLLGEVVHRKTILGMPSPSLAPQTESIVKREPCRAAMAAK